MHVPLAEDGRFARVVWRTGVQGADCGGGAGQAAHKWGRGRGDTHIVHNHLQYIVRVRKEIRRYVLRY